MIEQLTEENFDKKTANGLKIVEFYAPWCGFCKKQEPVLSEMEKFWIGKVNGDEYSKLVQRFKITGFPTFVIFNNGKEVERLVGFHTKFDFMNILNKYLI